MSDIIRILQRYKQGLLGEGRMLLILSKKCKNLHDEEVKKQSPFHINVISSAAKGRLKETAHSAILHDLLWHETLRNSFIEEIFEESTSGNVTIENPDHDRIDISFYTDDDFFIIENKVNDAVEQRGQIYRYYNIAKNKKYKEDSIHILYLNSYHKEPPSLFSRAKDGNDKSTEIIPTEKIIVKTFKDDILQWLKRQQSKFENTSHSNEKFLISALNQYIDYLEEYFQTTNKYDKLHAMTEQEIIQISELDNYPIEVRTEVLEQKIEELKYLQSEMDRLLLKYRNEEWEKILNQGLIDLNKEFNGKIRFREFSKVIPEIGFDAQFQEEHLHITVVYYNRTPYWRIFSNEVLPESTKEKIKNKLKPYLDDIKEGSKDWAFYKVTSKENWMIRLRLLGEIFNASPEFTINSPLA